MCICMVVCVCVFYRYNNKKKDRERTSTMLNINLPQTKYSTTTIQPAVVYPLAEAAPVNPHDFRLQPIVPRSTAYRRKKKAGAAPDTATTQKRKRTFIAYKCGNCQNDKTLATGHRQQKGRWWCPSSSVDYTTWRASLDK